MAYDTPYNERLLAVLEQYDLERDTNGEPDIFYNAMSGGAFLGADGVVVHHGYNLGDSYGSSGHPHLVHPLLGAMNREMSLSGGRRGFRHFSRSIGHSVVPVVKDVASDLGRYALKQGSKEAKRQGREYIDDYMTQDQEGGALPPGFHRNINDTRFVQGGYSFRPPGGVSHLVRSVAPNSLVSPGTMAAYPAYNAVEMAGMGVHSGAGFKHFASSAAHNTPAAARMELGMVGAAALPPGLKKARGRPPKTGGKMKFSRVMKKIAKHGVPIAEDLAVGLAIAAATGAGVESAAGVKRAVGRPRKAAMSAVDGSGFKKIAKRAAKKAAPHVIDFAKKEGKKALIKYLEGDAGQEGSGLKKFAKKSVKKAAPHVIDFAKEFAKREGKKALDKYLEGPDVQEGGKVKFSRVMKKIVKHGVPIAEDLAVGLAIAAATGAGVPSAAGVGKFTKKIGKSQANPYGSQIGAGVSDGRKVRADIVKKVMAEQGLKMIDASKYVKAHGLY
jgi:hypothetical protein